MVNKDFSETEPRLIAAPHFAYADGGRAAAGYKGVTGDCGVRAICIAGGYQYQEIYDLVKVFGARERITRLKRSKSHPRTGVFGPTMRKIMEHLGWDWTATMGIGTGCRVHLRADELPHDRLMVNVSKHYTTMIYGIIQDTWDPSRDGTRCVYGYWSKRL